jgi:hypothetical protein
MDFFKIEHVWAPAGGRVVNRQPSYTLGGDPHDRPLRGGDPAGAQTGVTERFLGGAGLSLLRVASR